MPRKAGHLKPVLAAVPSTDFNGHRVGKLASLDDQGTALVDFPGNPSRTPIRARSVLDAPAPIGADPQRLVGADVLLAFEDADPCRPVIVGILRDKLRPAPRPPEVKITGKGVQDVLIDGRRLVLDAQQELVIRCGKSRVTLTKDGKVLIKGEHVVSRASSTNKIKGGTISLN